MTEHQRLGPPRRLAGVHVLLVEDDPVVAGVFTTALEYYGAWVTVAPNHRTGLTLLRTLIPRVLVVGTSPGAGDGVSLLRVVRAFERARGVRIATLAITVDQTDRARDTALMAGFHACLGKPVDVHDFCRVVARLAGPALMGMILVGSGPDGDPPATRGSELGN